MRAKAHDYYDQDIGAYSERFPPSAIHPNGSSYRSSVLGFIDPGVDRMHILATMVLQRDSCFLTGRQFSHTQGSRRNPNHMLPSFDRVLNGLRHIPANLRLITYGGNIDRQRDY